MLAVSKPPYLRWVAAIVIVGAALAWDLGRTATEQAPFAAVPIDRGATIEPGDIQWRPAPRGLLPSTLPQGATAVVPIDAGEPIIGSLVTVGLVVPEGWWTVPVDTPTAALPGSRALIILDTGQEVAGLVVEPSKEDSFGIVASGLVAVPDEVASPVALAAAAGRLTVLYEP